MKKLALLTSGGDAPGMNSVIRAIVRSALKENVQVTGIKRGYEGLINGDFIDLGTDSVSDISDHGGTMLLSARSEEMRSEQGLKRAYEMARIFNFDALIVIGGDGSFTGATKLAKLGINTMCIPGTIDLDMAYTDYTIGFDTAINTGMEAISKIRDTTSSHERVSVVEVMGRNCGSIAIWCAVASGADEVLVPEMPDVDGDEVIRQIIKKRAKGKKHNLIVVAEGIGGSLALAKKIQETTGISSRATVLGHLQRGGAPTALDRVHGSSMGSLAVELILDGEKNKAIGFNNGKYSHTDILEALKSKHTFDIDLYKRVRNLSF